MQHRQYFITNKRDTQLDQRERRWESFSCLDVQQNSLLSAHPDKERRRKEAERRNTFKKIRGVIKKTEILKKNTHTKKKKHEKVFDRR